MEFDITSVGRVFYEILTGGKKFTTYDRKKFPKACEKEIKYKKNVMRLIKTYET